MLSVSFPGFIVSNGAAAVDGFFAALGCEQIYTIHYSEECGIRSEEFHSVRNVELGMRSFSAGWM